MQQILAEQNLTKSGAIDAETAVRVGRLMGACYSIYGGFMRDLTGGNVITAHTTSNETGQIENPEKVQSKGDDVMASHRQLSAKIGSDLKLNACRRGAQRQCRSGAAGRDGAGRQGRSGHEPRPRPPRRRPRPSRKR